MEHIKRQLNISLNKKGLNKAAQASYVCYLFEQFKNDILGSGVSAKAISFRGGALKIKVPDSVSASEIRFKGELIKEKINQKIGSKVISRIETRVIA